MILRFVLEPFDNTRLARVCGSLDVHLREIEAALGVKLSRRDAEFRVDGPKAAAERTRALLETLYERARRPLPAETLQLALVEAKTPEASEAAEGKPATTAALVLRTRRADLAARTPRQHQYLQQILSHDITFGLGPAGTGKTFLAVACAVDALERSAVQRIILTRPAVEAGERLGFLPGDLTQKVDPYLRPLYDALYDLLGFDRVTKAFEKAQLEVAPLAFMRGRTLNHAFVILDEAQNTTPEQMKMFLTRIGFRQPLRGHRRHQPDRPAARRAVRPHRRRARAGQGQGHRDDALHQRRRGAPPAGGPHRRGLRGPRQTRARDMSAAPGRSKQARSRLAGQAAGRRVHL